MKLFPNPDNNPWIDKYNALVLEVKSHEEENILKKKNQPKRKNGPLIEEYTGDSIGIHHIIPKKIDMSLVNDKDNLLYISLYDHCQLHYYLWKSNPDYAPHLQFIGYAGRKIGCWNMTDEEWKQLHKDSAAYRKKKKKGLI